MTLLVGGAVLVVLAAALSARPDIAERLPSAVVPIAAALAAVALALGEAAPTGWQPLDLLLRAGLGAGVVLAAARIAPGWTLWLALVAGAVLVVADAGSWEPLGAAGLAIAVVVVLVTGRHPALQALAAAAAVAPLAHVTWPLASGASAAAAAIAVLPLVVVGLAASPHRARRAAAWSLAVVVLVSVVGGVVGVLSALSARGDVDRAVDAALVGLDQVSEEDKGPAVAKLREAQAAFESAESTLRAWWARPALIVPVVAQHARAVGTMADSGAELTRVAATSLEDADLDSLQPTDGQIDLAAIAEVDGPLQEAAATLRRSDDRLAAVRSPLLVPPVATRLDDLADKVAEARRTADTAADALDVAPGLLGADGPRRYFLILQTPSELRGVGGFMGSWGELVLDQGRFDLVRTGRLRELIDGGDDPTGRRIEGQPEFVSRYGQDPAVAWGTIGFSPDFPTVASIIAQLYPQSGGSEIDGVISLDPASFASFLELTGPITVPGYDQSLAPETAEQILLHDQYLAFGEDDREAFLQDAIEVLFDELTSGDLPAPRAIADELGPAVAGRHLQLFAVDDAEQRFFRRIDAEGSARRGGEDDAVGIVGQNFNGNKIDYFLRRNATYDVTWDPGTGEITGSLEVEVTNLAPASGLPGSVISWGGDVSAGQVPVADGENLHLLSLYAGQPLDDITLDGEPAELYGNTTELGYQVRDVFLRLPAGATQVVRATVDGRVPEGRTYELGILRQPTATEDQITVRIRLAPGWQLRGGGQELSWTGDTSAPIRVVARAEPSTPSLIERLKGP